MRQTWLIRHANEQATMLAEAAAFLDGLARRLEARPIYNTDDLRATAAADCRAMAKRLRGEESYDAAMAREHGPDFNRER